MPRSELLVAFFITTAVFAYIPGPAMLYAAAQTLARGRLAGLMASLGIHLGCYVHVLAAAAGLSVLFHAVPTLYLVVKLAGAGYLVSLGISLFRAKATATSPRRQPCRNRAGALSSRASPVEVLNPKTAIFFLAFLPQFIDASALFPVWLQFVVLGTLVNVMFSSADVVRVLLASAVFSKLRSSDRAQRVLRRMGGALLVGLGTHLALQRT